MNQVEAPSTPNIDSELEDAVDKASIPLKENIRRISAENTWLRHTLERISAEIAKSGHRMRAIANQLTIVEGRLIRAHKLAKELPEQSKALAKKKSNALKRNAK